MLKCNYFSCDLKSCFRSPKKTILSFTLVELIVVVAILGILTALMVPTINKALEQSKINLCLGNLRQNGQGVLLYAADNKSQLPVSRADGNIKQPYYTQCAGSGSPWEWYSMGKVVEQHYADPDTLYCPGLINARDLYIPYSREEWLLRNVWAPTYFYTDYSLNPYATVSSQQLYTSINDFPADKILAVDVLGCIDGSGTTPMTAGEIEGSLQHVNLFNKLLPDGSARSKYSPSVYDTCVTNTYDIKVGKDWTKYRPLITELEQD